MSSQDRKDGTPAIAIIVIVFLVFAFPVVGWIAAAIYLFFKFVASAPSGPESSFRTGADKDSPPTEENPRSQSQDSWARWNGPSLGDCLGDFRRSYPRFGIIPVYGWCVYVRGDSEMSWSLLDNLLSRAESSSRFFRPQGSDGVEALWHEQVCLLVFGEGREIKAALHEVIEDLEVRHRLSFWSTSDERQRAIEVGREHLSKWVASYDSGDFNAHSSYERSNSESQDSIGVSSDGMSIEEARRVLGVNASSSVDDIKKAYRARIAQWHPDKLDGMAKELRDLATKKSAELNLAFAVLNGKNHRAAAR